MWGRVEAIELGVNSMNFKHMERAIMVDTILSGVRRPISQDSSVLTNWRGTPYDWEYTTQK